MGELIDCGEMSVQTKYRVALTEVAKKHNINPGDKVRVVLQKIDDEDSYESEFNIVRVAEELKRMLPWFKSMRETVKLLEDPIYIPDIDKGHEFRSIHFTLEHEEQKLRECLNLLGLEVDFDFVKTELTEKEWNGIAMYPLNYYKTLFTEEELNAPDMVLHKRSRSKPIDERLICKVDSNTEFTNLEINGEIWRGRGDWLELVNDNLNLLSRGSEYYKYENNEGTVIFKIGLKVKTSQVEGLVRTIRKCLGFKGVNIICV